MVSLLVGVAGVNVRVMFQMGKQRLGELGRCAWGRDRQVHGKVCTLL